MKRFKNILCVVEPDSFSKAAVIQAVELAKNNQSKLNFVTIVNKAGFISSMYKDEMQLNEALKELVGNKQTSLDLFLEEFSIDVEFETKVLVGISFIEIIREVLREEHDLVVKCSTNPNWVERIFGNNDMNLLRKCPCPVLMLKSDQLKPCRNILATVDLMEDDLLEGNGLRVQHRLNEKVILHSITFSLVGSVNMHIGSVWNAYGEDFLRHGAFSQMPENEVEHYVEQTRKDYIDKLAAFKQGVIAKAGKEAIEYISLKTHLAKGMPEKEIPIMAKKYDIDLIVMGTIARTGIAGLVIGNTAESILEQVKCSVLAIKPDGFKTPVTLND